MSIISKIKSDPRLKRIVLYLLIPKNEYRPRLWVRWFLNPFKHKRGKGSVVRWKTRMDLFPFNGFNLGKKAIIEDFVTINNGVGDVEIGENTIIGMGCVVIGPVNIGSNVMFAQNIVVSGLNHSYEDVTIAPSLQKVSCKQIIISNDVWIGANSTITAGVTLGKHCIVGGGSVVTKDVPPFTVVAGNPAKAIKEYNFESNLWQRCK